MRYEQTAVWKFLFFYHDTKNVSEECFKNLLCYEIYARPKCTTSDGMALKTNVYESKCKYFPYFKDFCSCSVIICAVNVSSSYSRLKRSLFPGITKLFFQLSKAFSEKFSYIWWCRGWQLCLAWQANRKCFLKNGTLVEIFFLPSDFSLGIYVCWISALCFINLRLLMCK